MNRYTFVLQVHAGGPSTLENLSTQERVRISDLEAVGPQIARWLRELPAPRAQSASPSDGPPPPATAP